MLRDMKKLEGFSLQTTDGKKIGKVHSFYFDDQSGIVRYLVVNTGNWLTGRQVLISPEALETPNWLHETLPVNLTKAQIESSPAIGTDEPVSRQMEVYLRNYYGWAPYWQTAVAPNPWQTMPPSTPGQSEEAAPAAQAVKTEEYDPHLRSSREVIGYHIEALDGDIGHVETFLVDDSNWRIHYLVVDTHNWLPGKKVLVAPQWMNRIVWEDHKVHVNLQKEQIESSPEYNDDVPVTDAYEKALFEHYNSREYWML